jgi:hypothetical protein
MDPLFLVVQALFREPLDATCGSQSKALVSWAA